MARIQQQRRLGRRKNSIPESFSCRLLQLSVRWLLATTVLIVSVFHLTTLGNTSDGERGNFLLLLPPLGETIEYLLDQEPKVRSILPNDIYERQGSYPFHGCLHHSNCSIHFPIHVTPKNVKEASTKESSAQYEQHGVHLLTQHGNVGKDKPNQDRSVAITMNGGFVGGLFDGHGPYGHEVAEWAMSDLLVRLWPALIDRKDPVSDTEIQHVLNASFVEVDQGRLSSLWGSGSTGILVWQKGRRIVLASVGDSTGLLVRWNGTSSEILTRTIHHKPSNPEERNRILAAGGTVSNSGRVKFDNGRGCKKCWGLGMSRSFGDTYGKEGGILVAEPAVQILAIPPEAPEDATNIFVVLASDGLLDFLDDALVANAIGSSLFDSDHSKNKRSLPDACRHMIRQSIKRWAKHYRDDYDFLFRDDMSLLVAKLAL